MKSSDSTFGYTRREAFRLGMSSLAAMWFGSPVVSALSQTTIDPAPTGPYTLPPLPYPYEALEPQIDTLTMQIHHDKHHKAYVDNANKLLADQPELAKLSPEDLLKNLEQGSGSYPHWPAQQCGRACQSLVVLADDVARRAEASHRASSPRPLKRSSNRSTSSKSNLTTLR